MPLIKFLDTGARRNEERGPRVTTPPSLSHEEQLVNCNRRCGSGGGGGGGGGAAGRRKETPNDVVIFPRLSRVSRERPMIFLSSMDAAACESDANVTRTM